MARPRLDSNDESVPVNVRLPAKQYDALYQLARDARVSVPEVVRRALDRELGQDAKK